MGSVRSRTLGTGGARRCAQVRPKREVDSQFLVYLAGHHPVPGPALRRGSRRASRQASSPRPCLRPPAAGSIGSAAWSGRSRLGRIGDGAGGRARPVAGRRRSADEGAAGARDPAGETARVRSPPTATLSHLLLFDRMRRRGDRAGRGGRDKPGATANLLPDGGLWLRAPDGRPDRADGDRVGRAGGGRRGRRGAGRYALTVPGGPGARTHVPGWPRRRRGIRRRLQARTPSSCRWR